jgi:hypothetical protein
MFRILLNCATAISLILLLLCSSAWFRSERTMDSLIVRARMVVALGSLPPSSPGGPERVTTAIRAAVWELDSRQGQLRILHAGPLFDRKDKWLWWRRSADRHVAWTLPDTRADQTWNAIQAHLIRSRAEFAGFMWETGDGPGYEYAPIKMFVVPWWSLSAIGAVLPTIWSWQRLRRFARSREGLCEICGYDLRATRERCPECGTGASRLT